MSFIASRRAERERACDIVYAGLARPESRGAETSGRQVEPQRQPSEGEPSDSRLPLPAGKKLPPCFVLALLASCRSPSSRPRFLPGLIHLLWPSRVAEARVEAGSRGFGSIERALVGRGRPSGALQPSAFSLQPPAESSGESRVLLATPSERDAPHFSPCSWLLLLAIATCGSWRSRAKWACRHGNPEKEERRTSSRQQSATMKSLYAELFSRRSSSKQPARFARLECHDEFSWLRNVGFSSLT